MLAGGGYGLADARPAVELVHALRGAPIIERPSRVHPALASTRVAPPPHATWPPPPKG